MLGNPLSVKTLARGDQPVPDMVMSRLKELMSWMFDETESLITKLITWSGLTCCPSRCMHAY
jgi:hypothetical protein